MSLRVLALSAAAFVMGCGPSVRGEVRVGGPGPNSLEPEICSVEGFDQDFTVIGLTSRSHPLWALRATLTRVSSAPTISMLHPQQVGRVVGVDFLDLTNGDGHAVHLDREDCSRLRVTVYQEPSVTRLHGQRLYSHGGRLDLDCVDRKHGRPIAGQIDFSSCLGSSF
jgi:hypothetical protein